MGREWDHVEESDPLPSLSSVLGVFLDSGFPRQGTKQIKYPGND